MPPIEIAENYWRLLEGESVTGKATDKSGSTVTATLKGPQFVRTFPYPEINKMRVQGRETNIEVEGTSFEAVVKTESSNDPQK